MTERKYSVREIDDLRRVIETRWLYGTSSLPFSKRPRMSRSYMEDEKNKAVEELVRTHMLAGHTAEDILSADAVKV